MGGEVWRCLWRRGMGSLEEEERVRRRWELRRARRRIGGGIVGLL
jgi:hypothetical protein